ncbi:glutamine amidotransferase [Sediminibacterium magnilacihabitans]|nr:glutamine amidotransferase [Sediminibacterium magnilacihabitans]
MITIVDYGMGNLGSVQNMFKRIGVESRISGDPAVITDAQKLLLPGVGAFDAAMQSLENSGLIPVLHRKALDEKVPILGICLGMQLLTAYSEEGNLPGLGWISAKTIKFNFPDNGALKIPHMGWNDIIYQNESLLTKDLPDEPRFYFVHSYYVQCNKRDHVLCTTKYGTEFDSIICQGNIYGAQFHPEKSHKFGMKLLKNFSEI